MKSFLNILYWTFGVGFAIVSTMFYSDSIIVALLIFVMAIFVLPPVQKVLLDATGKTTPEWVKITILIVLVWFVTHLSNQENEKRMQITRDAFSANKAKILSDIEANLKANNIDNASAICSEYLIVTDNNLESLCTKVKDEQSKMDAIKTQEAAAKAQQEAENAQAQNEAEAAQVIEAIPLVSAGILLEAFNNNGIRANDEYQGKKIRINGVVDIIGGESGQVAIVLSGGNDFSVDGVQCNFDDKDEIVKIKNINKGNAITVIGTVDSLQQVDGLRKNVMVTDCSLL